jgi:hypothetical protein
MNNILTQKRYRVSTIFVDHLSNLSFVHLQASTASNDTLQAKHEFKRYAQILGGHGLGVDAVAIVIIQDEDLRVATT